MHAYDAGSSNALTNRNSKLKGVKIYSENSHVQEWGKLESIPNHPGERQDYQHLSNPLFPYAAHLGPLK